MIDGHSINYVHIILDMDAYERFGNSLRSELLSSVPILLLGSQYPILGLVIGAGLFIANVIISYKKNSSSLMQIFTIFIPTCLGAACAELVINGVDAGPLIVIAAIYCGVCFLVDEVCRQST